jgi:cation diffusion facilitator family transporter
MHVKNTQIESQHYASQKTHAAQRVTLWGLVINLLLSGIKFLFGFLGNSQALVADAVHSLSDATTDVAVLIGAPYWSAPADAEHPHGHSRIETMITFFVGAVLAGVGLGLICNALATLHAPHTTMPGWIVFVTACISIVSKELLYRWTLIVAMRIKSSALIANAWHHRSDGLSSIPVALAVVGMRLRPDWTYLDHVAALMVSLLILQASWKILWPALNQLMDTGATQEQREKLLKLILNIEGVKATHALRTRRVGNGLQVDLHLLVDQKLTVEQGHQIASIVKERLFKEGDEVIDVLIHVEPYEMGE